MPFQNVLDPGEYEALWHTLKARAMEETSFPVFHIVEEMDKMELTARGLLPLKTTDKTEGENNNETV